MNTALSLPTDVRLMNGVASAIFMATAAVLLAAGALWLMRSPGFSIRAIEVRGELQRSSPAALRAHVLPRLTGNFFSLDLQSARAAFESAPWVRHAVVRRVWPDRLAVTLEEHQPVARWAAEDGTERLVNAQGEVFEANPAELQADTLPLLGGPDGSSQRLLEAWKGLSRSFQRIDQELLELQLSGRGSWRAVLTHGVTVELGRGDPAEIQARVERFVGSVSQVTSYYKAPLLRADLRHPGGYAVRLRGMTTTEATGAGKDK